MEVFKQLAERYPSAIHTLGKDSEKWAKQARLDWEIRESQLAYTPDGKRMHLFEGQRVFFRSDTEEALAVVGKKFRPVQPKAILDFYGEIAERYGFKLAIAGEIGNGRKIWAMAETPHEFALAHGDKVSGGLFVMTGCDGSLSTQGFFSSFRLYCMNQLPVIDRHARRGAKLQVFRCTHGSDFTTKRVERDLEIMETNWVAFKKQAEALAAKKVTEQQAVDFFRKHFTSDEALAGIKVAEVETMRDNHSLKRLLGAYRKGEGQEQIQGTAWGVVNAVTNYLDHGQRAREDTTRVRKAWIDGAKLKAEVLEDALQTFAPKVLQ